MLVYACVSLCTLAHTCTRLVCPHGCMFVRGCARLCTLVRSCTCQSVLVQACACSLAPACAPGGLFAAASSCKRACACPCSCAHVHVLVPTSARSSPVAPPPARLRAPLVRACAPGYPRTRPCGPSRLRVARVPPSLARPRAPRVSLCPLARSHPPSPRDHIYAFDLGQDKGTLYPERVRGTGRGDTGGTGPGGGQAGGPHAHPPPV